MRLVLGQLMFLLMITVAVILLLIIAFRVWISHELLDIWLVPLAVVFVSTVSAARRFLAADYGSRPYELHNSTLFWSIIALAAYVAVMIVPRLIGMW